MASHLLNKSPLPPWVNFQGVAGSITGVLQFQAVYICEPKDKEGSLRPATDRAPEVLIVVVIVVTVVVEML